MGVITSMFAMYINKIYCSLLIVQEPVQYYTYFHNIIMIASMNFPNIQPVRHTKCSCHETTYFDFLWPISQTEADPLCQ